MDAVNNPKHYTSHPSAVECIEITRHLSFNRGNAFKYLFRRNDKGSPMQDLQKALWYIRDEIRHYPGHRQMPIEVIGLLAQIRNYEPEVWVARCFLAIALGDREQLRKAASIIQKQVTA